MQTVSSSCCHAAPRGCLKRNVTAPRSLPRAHLGGQEDRPSTVKASMVHWTAVAAALQLALLPAGAALAQLDTTTEKAGLSAKVEYSDLKDQEGSQALTKLMQELIPQAEEAIGKMEASDKVTTAKQELGKVKKVSQDIQKQVADGKTQSQIRSSVSGTEQQLNALKAIVGLN